MMQRVGCRFMDLMEGSKIGLSGELGEGSQLPEESESREEGRMVQVTGIVRKVLVLARVVVSIAPAFSNPMF